MIPYSRQEAAEWPSIPWLTCKHGINDSAFAGLPSLRDALYCNPWLENQMSLWGKSTKLYTRKINEETKMHYVKAKGILSAQNGMNLYRGCSHGCIYCDSRSKCYHMEHDFEDIEIKENAIELLETSLQIGRAHV